MQHSLSCVLRNVRVYLTELTTRHS